METKDRGGLALAAGKIAMMAAGALERQLSGEAGGRIDTKSARDLSGIMKDMAALSREAQAGERELLVEFSPEAEELAR